MRMSVVQVNDENGKSLGKVRVGDTKLQALERLSRVGDGGLYDKEDVGLLDNECITVEGAPYIFKPRELQFQKRKFADNRIILITLNLSNLFLTSSSLSIDISTKSLSTYYRDLPNAFDFHRKFTREAAETARQHH